MGHFDVISAMDWITPVSAFLHSARYLFQTREITFPDDISRGKIPMYIPQDWTMADVTAMLTKTGIENWGHHIWDDRAYFTVRKRDYARAIRLIQETVMNPHHKAPRHTLLTFPRRFFQDGFAWLIFVLCLILLTLCLLQAIPN